MKGFDFPVEVLRTDRKRSAAIYVEHEIVKVRVPKSLSDKRIRELVKKRTPWIKAKLKEISERPISKPKEYVSGEAFSYLGKNYRLKVVVGDCSAIKLKGGYFHATVLDSDQTPQATIRANLISWYQQHAKKRLDDKIKRWAKIVGVEPNSVTVKDYKSRWGSCSTKGDISFNWRIILAPHKIVDYVVVHELCHLQHLNHSPSYWRSVKGVIPDYKEHRQWLQSNERNLRA